MPSHVWFVREGQVALGAIDASGLERSYAVRGPGAVVGIEGLLGRPVKQQAWAVTDVRACGITLDELRDWLGDQRGPVGALLRLALEEVAVRAAERHGLQGSTVQRTARYLLEAHRRPSAGRHEVSRQIMARTLDMRPETLSRALRELRTRCAIAPGRQLRVRDAALLERIAGDAHTDAE